MPCVITGSLAAGNRQAIDCGWQGFVAYGCQSSVVVWHPSTMERVNTLDGHKQHVVKVRWARENYPHSDIVTSMNLSKTGRGSSHTLRLASADSGGNIIIWDVLKGRILCQFSDGHKPVLEMQWLWSQDVSVDLVAALHAPYSLILWNAQEGTKVWKKGYTETLSTFTLDPFQTSRAAFLTQTGNVMLIDDFSTTKTPSSNGQQFRVATVQQSNSGNVAEEFESATVASSGAKKPTAAALANLLVKKPLVKVFTSVAGGASGLDHQDQTNSSLQQSSTTTATQLTQSPSWVHADENVCVQLAYHRGVKNRLLLLYPKELLILDVVSMQSVAQIILDKSASPFVHVYPCAQRDAIFFFQENGCITLRMQKYRPTGSSASASGQATQLDQTLDIYNPLEIFYEPVCSAESLRVTKANRILAGTVCPITERRCCQVMNQGRFLVYELVSGMEGTQTSNTVCDISSNLIDDIHLDAKTLNQETPISGRTKLRFVMSGAGHGLASNPTVVRACPKPSGPGRQLAAIGFGDGGVQLVDIHSGEMERDFGLHSCSIKCLEWSGADHIISSGHSQTLSTSSLVRNEILLTDVRTGFSRRLRGECDESPVEMLRVSYFNCFLAIAFRDQPMEIWDLKQFRLLRRMSKNCPVIVDMAWSTKHHQSRVVSANAENDGEQQQPQLLPQTATSPASSAPSIASPADDAQHTIYRENLVVLDNENHLYHVVVKGIHVRDGKEVNTQWATNSLVTCMTWKDDLLAFGDVDGRLSVWNLEAKTSKATGHQRGAVRRLQMARGPADFTLIAIHADGAAVWNALRFECLHQVNTAPGVFTPSGLVSSLQLPWRVIDGDIAGDENWPLFLTGDGSLRVFDRSLTSGLNRNIESLLSQKIFVGRYQASWKTMALLKVILMDLENMRKIYTSKDDFELIDLGISPREKPASLSDIVKRLDIDDQDKWMVMRQLTLLEDELSCNLANLKPVERCRVVSRIFGEEWECHFWTVADHFLQERSDFLLSTCYENYWGAEDFKRWQIKLCSIFDCRRATVDQLHRLIDEFIQLGLYSQASQLLLDTDCQQPDYYADCLKACLLSTLAIGNVTCNSMDGQDTSLTSTGSTIKLVATNLIANGRLNEGVQLLTMIGKGLDACRYLQSFGQWEQSAWLARVALSKTSCQEVMGKWIDALQGPQMAKKTIAVLLMISCGQWERIIEALIGWRQLIMALQLLECEQVKDKASDKIKQILKCEYARELCKLGLMKAARKYATDAGGDHGTAVLKEIEFVSES